MFTGVGESLDRDECAEIAKQYGAKVTTSISGKTSYLVVGEGAGESKTAKVHSPHLNMSYTAVDCYFAVSIFLIQLFFDNGFLEPSLTSHVYMLVVKCMCTRCRILLLHRPSNWELRLLTKMTF